MKSLESQAKETEATIEILFESLSKTLSHYSKVNKHRHLHLVGLNDHHTKYQSPQEHIEGLRSILKGLKRDYNDIKKYLNQEFSQLNSIYGNMDAEQDLIDDAEISYNEVMKELLTI